MSKSLRDIGGCQSPKAKPQTMEGNGGRNSEKKMPLTSSTCDGGNKKGGEGERGGTMTSNPAPIICVKLKVPVKKRR